MRSLRDRSEQSKQQEKQRRSKRSSSRSSRIRCREWIRCRSRQRAQSILWMTQLWASLWARMVDTPKTEVDRATGTIKTHLHFQIWSPFPWVILKEISELKIKPTSQVAAAAILQRVQQSWRSSCHQLTTELWSKEWPAASSTHVIRMRYKSHTWTDSLFNSAEWASQDRRPMPQVLMKYKESPPWLTSSTTTTPLYHTGTKCKEFTIKRRSVFNWSSLLVTSCQELMALKAMPVSHC